MNIIFSEKIKSCRQQIVQMQQELENLEDYLDVLEVRKISLGQKKYTQAEIEKHYAKH